MVLSPPRVIFEHRTWELTFPECPPPPMKPGFFFCNITQFILNSAKVVSCKSQPKLSRFFSSNTLTLHLKIQPVLSKHDSMVIHQETCIYPVHPRAAYICQSLQCLVASKVTGVGLPWIALLSTSTCGPHWSPSSSTFPAPSKSKKKKH